LADVRKKSNKDMTAFAKHEPDQQINTGLAFSLNSQQVACVGAGGIVSAIRTF
jgi:hypothetical protein